MREKKYPGPQIFYKLRVGSVVQKPRKAFSSKASSETAKEGDSKGRVNSKAIEYDELRGTPREMWPSQGISSITREPGDITSAGF